jgi:hypothetical protein
MTRTIDEWMRLRPGDDYGDLWYEVETDVYLNLWCKDYVEARRVLESNGGYLLPYRRQFVVVGPQYVELLGLDPHDSSWERIGFDLAAPADRDAFRQIVTERLEGRMRNHG